MKKNYCCFYLTCVLAILISVTELAQAQCDQPDSNTFAAANELDTSVDLSWGAVATATGGYNMRYRILGEAVWDYLPVPTNSLTLTGLMPDTDYEFDVESICDSGTSGYPQTFGTIEWGTRFTTTLPCPMPENLSVNNIEATTGDAMWDNVSVATSYNVQYTYATGTTWTNAYSGTNTTATLTGLDPETDYDVQVQAVCNSLTSDWTAAFRFRTEELCALTSNLAVTNITTTSADLSWDAVNNGSDYNIQYRSTVPAGGAWTTINNVSSPYTLTGLSPNTDYEFDIQSNCTNGSSSPFTQEFFRFSTAEDTPAGVYIRAYLQGAFNDGVSADGNMTAGLIGTNPLTGNSIIPLTQPYNVAPFNYAGTENIAAPFADMVDWVLVEAATTQTTASVVERRAGILHTNGLITDVDGTSPLAFSTLTSGAEYFFIIRHRNHLPAVTHIAFDIATTSAAAPHDMTTQQSLVAGAIPCLNDLGADGIGNENYPGLFGLILGNADGNGNVNLSDRLIWEEETGSFFNYNVGDFDMDRFVNVNDRIVWDLNTGAFVHPSIWP